MSFVTGEDPIQDGNGYATISFTPGDTSCRPQPTTTTTTGAQPTAVVAQPRFTG